MLVFLSRTGAKPGDRIGIFLENSLTATAGVYASAMLGLTYVPLAVDDPPERVAGVIRAANIKFVLYLDASPGEPHKHLRASARDIVFLEAHEALFADADEFRTETTPTTGTHPLYILFTSGSTGQPKGIPIRTDGVKNFIEWARGHFSPTANDVFLAHSKLTFDLSVFNLFLPFMSGASVRIPASPSERIYPGSILKEGISIALLVPRVTGLMLEAGQLSPNAYPKLRHIIFCGERLHAHQVLAWRSASPSVTAHNIYGPTETTVTCTYFDMPPKMEIEDPIPVGHVIPGMTVSFLDSKSEVINGPCVGEAVISGVGVSPYGYIGPGPSGYFSHPILGKSFHSGDILSRDAQGLLYWHHRVDHQIKIRGFRVDLGEIESVLGAHPLIADLACVYDPDSDSVVVFFSSKETAGAPQKEGIIADLKATSERLLPQYMIPSRYEARNTLPRNKNGKIDRALLATSI